MKSAVDLKPFKRIYIFVCLDYLKLLFCIVDEKQIKKKSVKIRSQWNNILHIIFNDVSALGKNKNNHNKTDKQMNKSNNFFFLHVNAFFFLLVFVFVFIFWLLLFG